MELASGTPLSDLLPEVSRGDWHNQKLVDTFIQTCTALEWAHAHSVIHGDLRPSNIFLLDSSRQDASEPLVKVSDFGIVGESDPLYPGMLIGECVYFVDFWYMSPEQRESWESKCIDSRSDIYALGCIMFEAYSGHKLSQIFRPDTFWSIPVDNRVPLQLWPDGDPGFGEVIKKACLFSDSRYQSAGEMREDLERLKRAIGQAPCEVTVPPSHHLEGCPTVSAGAGIASDHLRVDTKPAVTETLVDMSHQKSITDYVPFSAKDEMPKWCDSIAIGPTGFRYCVTIGDRRLEVKGRLGKGARTEVYLAQEDWNDRLVALKVFEHNGDKDELHWFMGKARAQSPLSHPNIAAFYHYHPFVNGHSLIAMELINRHGLPLDRKYCGDPIWFDIFPQVCRALGWAHEHGIVHGDLKPSNVHCVSWSNYHPAPKPLVKVCDFAISISDPRHYPHRFADRFVDPWHISPEQRSGERVDHRSDIYALGCLMFECLSGHELSEIFEAGKVGALPIEDPQYWMENDRGFGTIIKKATELEPTERYQNAYEILKDLERAKGVRICSGWQPSSAAGGIAEESDTDSRSEKVESKAKPLSPGAKRKVAIATAVVLLMAGLSQAAWNWMTGSGISPQLIAEIIVTPWSEYDRRAQQLLDRASSKSEVQEAVPVLRKAIARAKIEPGKSGEQHLVTSLRELRISYKELDDTKEYKEVDEAVRAHFDRAQKLEATKRERELCNVYLKRLDAKVLSKETTGKTGAAELSSLVSDAIKLAPTAELPQSFLQDARQRVERLATDERLLRRLVLAQEFWHQNSNHLPATECGAAAILEAKQDETLTDPTTCYQLAWLLCNHNEAELAENFANRALASPQLSTDLDIRLEQLLAEIAWRKGDKVAATQGFEKAIRKAETVIPRDYDRLCDLLLVAGSFHETEGIPALSNGLINRGMAMFECERDEMSANTMRQYFDYCENRRAKIARLLKEVRSWIESAKRNEL